MLLVDAENGIDIMAGKPPKRRLKQEIIRFIIDLDLSSVTIETKKF